MKRIAGTVAFTGIFLVAFHMMGWWAFLVVPVAGISAAIIQGVFLGVYDFLKEDL